MKAQDYMNIIADLHRTAAQMGMWDKWWADLREYTLAYEQAWTAEMEGREAVPYLVEFYGGRSVVHTGDPERVAAGCAASRMCRAGLLLKCDKVAYVKHQLARYGWVSHNSTLTLTNLDTGAVSIARTSPAHDELGAFVRALIA